MYAGGDEPKRQVKMRNKVKILAITFVTERSLVVRRIAMTPVYFMMILLPSHSSSVEAVKSREPSQAMGAARRIDRENARQICDRIWNGFYDECLTNIMLFVV